MGFFAWLFARTPDIDTPPPAWRPAVAPTPDSARRQASALASETDTFFRPPENAQTLEQVFTVIDYKDAAGRETRRRITMVKMWGESGRGYVLAVCHERQALRTFRTDRIQCFIDAETGEILLPKAFFKTVFAIDLDAWQTPARRRADDRLIVNIRDYLHSPLSLLVAAARADKDYHAAEIAEVQLYGEREVERLDAAKRFYASPDAAEIDALCQTIDRMRPQRGSIARHLRNVLRMPKEEQDRFNIALARVINADGVVRVEEEEFLRELADLGHDVFQIDEA